MHCLKKKKKKYNPQETLWNKHLAWYLETWISESTPFKTWVKWVSKKRAIYFPEGGKWSHKTKLQIFLVQEPYKRTLNEN